MNIECSQCGNDLCLIKKHCQNKKLQTFLAAKNMFSCKAGQQFILEGSPVYGLYFIYQGVVKVHKNTQHSSTQIIRFSKAGEIVGHRGFGTSYVYDISASAIENTVLCNFSTAVIIEMLHKVPELMFDFMLFYADQLQKSEANAKHFARMSVREKVLSGLQFIANKFGQEQGFITVPLSRKDIADFAGISTDQAIRVISALKKEGILLIEGKKIGICPTNPTDAGSEVVSYYLEG